MNHFYCNVDASWWEVNSADGDVFINDAQVNNSHWALNTNWQKGVSSGVEEVTVAA